MIMSWDSIGAAHGICLLLSSKTHSDKSRLGSVSFRSLDSTIGNRRLPDSDLRTRLQAAQVAQPGVGDASALDKEEAQPVEAGECKKACVTHRRLIQPEVPEIRQPGDVDQAGVGDLGSIQARRFSGP